MAWPSGHASFLFMQVEEARSLALAEKLLREGLDNAASYDPQALAAPWDTVPAPFCKKSLTFRSF